jgi:type II secretory pathway pseudopilin PulG
MNPAPLLPQRAVRHAAFTLVEVVLAISLAIGILVIALGFYQQATSLRGQIIEASERLSTIRLLMDRLTADLRAARAHDWEGFNGDSASLRFVKSEALIPSGWTRNEPSSDLRLVSFGVTTGLDGTNTVVTGLTRSERPALEPRQTRAAATAPLESASTNNPVNAAVAIEPLTDVVKFLRFRFWDGTAWLDAWSDVVPPLGVEVSFGLDPQPDDALPEEYPFELFRRVIALPGGRASDPFAELFSSASSEVAPRSKP